MQATATQTTTEVALARVRDQLAACKAQLDAYAQCRHGEESYHDRMREAMWLLKEQDRLLAIIAKSTDVDESPELPESDDDMTCEHCGAVASELDGDSYCPECSAAAMAHAEAEERYQDAVSEQEEAESDLESAEAELAELLERIANAKTTVKDTAKNVAKYGRQLEAAEAKLETLAK